MALAYEKNLATLETVKIAEIFNITRVLFLPFLLIILALYASRQTLTKADSRKMVLQKFPLFIFGFLAMTALTSMGCSVHLISKHCEASCFGAFPSA